MPKIPSMKVSKEIAEKVAEKALSALPLDKPKAAAGKVWNAFTNRFLIMYNNNPYWDTKKELAARPGEWKERPTPAMSYPELEFDTGLYKRKDMKINTGEEKGEGHVTLDPLDSFAVPDHFPRFAWVDEDESLKRIARLSQKGYVTLGCTYKADPKDFPVFGIDSDFLYIESAQ